MAALVSRRVRRIQPAPGEALAIDWSNPITRDMTVHLVHADQAYGYAAYIDSNGFPAVQNAFPYVAGAQSNTVLGTGARTTSSASIYDLTAKGAVNSPSYSLFAFGTCTSLSVTQSALDMDNGTTRYFQFRIANGKADFIPFNTSGSPTGQATSPVALSLAEMSRGFSIGATASPTRTAVFQNGVVTAATPSSMIAPGTNMPIKVGARQTGVQAWSTGGLMLVVVWTRTLSDAEMQSLADNPWQLIRPQPARRLYLAWSASTGTTIAANTGAVSIAGLPATVSAPTNIAAAVATTLIQGQAAQVVTPANIAASTGAVSVAGLAAQVVTPTVIAASVAAVSVAGRSASIVMPANVAASTGAVTVVGLPASISSGNGISCTTAAVTVQGQPVVIVAGAAINCATGAVTVSGKTASVSAATNIACGTAAVTVAGLAATIAIPTDISARAAAVAVAGQAAQIVTPDGIACGLAAVTVAGQPATITSYVPPRPINPKFVYVGQPRQRAYVGQPRQRSYP